MSFCLATPPEQAKTIALRRLAAHRKKQPCADTKLVALNTEKNKPDCSAQGLSKLTEAHCFYTNRHTRAGLSLDMHHFFLWGRALYSRVCPKPRNNKGAGRLMGALLLGRVKGKTFQACRIFPLCLLLFGGARIFDDLRESRFGAVDDCLGACLQRVPERFVYALVRGNLGIIGFD